VEWRVVFTKLGVMDVLELEAWTSHLDLTVPNCHDLPMMHASLICVESESPWTFLSPDHHDVKELVIPASTKDRGPPLFIDASASTYALFTTKRLPLTSTTSLDVATELPYIPEAGEDPSPTCSIPIILPLSTASLIRVPNAACTTVSMVRIHLLHSGRSRLSTLPAEERDGEEGLQDITRNYHQLSVLAGLRGRLGVNPILPWHLAAVESMASALARGDIRVE